MVSEDAAPNALTPPPRWRTLHPASVIVNLVPVAWRTLRAVWPFLLASLWSRPQGTSAWSDLGIIGAFGALSVVRTVVHFATLRYRVHEGRLEIHTGLLSLNHRVIDPQRIQNVELVRNPFHRAAGLVEVRIETAGGTSTEGLLSALSVADAEELQAALELARAERRPADPAVGSGGSAGPGGGARSGAAPAFLRVGAPALLYFGLSRWQLGAAMVTLVGLQQVVLAVTGSATQASAAGRPVAQTLAIVLLVFVASLVVAGAGALVRHHAFVLRDTGRGLASEEGLFTRRRVELRLDKVQLVRIEEPLLRRAVGHATVAIETAGLSVREGLPAQAECVVPMVSTDDELPELLARVLAPLDLRSKAYARAAVGALLLRVGHTVVRRGALLAVAAWWLRDASSVRLPVAVAVGAWALWGVLKAGVDWLGEGWQLVSGHLVVRHGVFSRETLVVPLDKVQSVHVAQGPLQRALGLAEVQAHVAGSRVRCPPLAVPDAATLAGGLARHGADHLC